MERERSARIIQGAWRASRGGWMPANARNAGFRNAVLANRNGGQKYGGTTSYGTVTKIKGPFVKKTMKITGDDMKIFTNEVRVGSLPGIKRVGPKIYAWRVLRDSRDRITSAEYIMDDFTAVPPDHVVFTLHQYAHALNSCPRADDPIFPLMKKTLTNFWRITKGYHGDLHMNNLAVVINKKTTMPLKVIIFDYGSHKKFKNFPGNAACFEDFVKKIDEEFTKRFSKSKTVYGYLNDTGTRVAEGRRGQPRRSNANMLRHFTMRSKRNVNNSMMLHLNPSDKVLNVIRRKPTFRPGDDMLKRYRKLYPGKTKEELRKGLGRTFAGLDYNKNKTLRNNLAHNVPSIKNKASFNAAVANVSKLTPLKTNDPNKVTAHYKNLYPLRGNNYIRSIVRKHYV